MQNQKFLFLSTLLILLICSCGRDNELTMGETTLTPIDAEYYTEGQLSGHIIGEDNTGLSEALIKVNGVETTTDENGFFVIKNIRLSSNGTVIKVSKADYFDGFKFGFIEPGQNSMVRIKMIPANKVGEFDSSEGGAFNLGKGSEVYLPPAAIVDEDGSDYSGKTIIKAHWYDPRDPRLAESMPGDLRGLSENGTAVQLTTYGMMAVELEDESGNKLQIKPGTKARLTFPMAADANAPSSIPMWHLDEETGIWIEEGLATKDGNNMIAEVAHFSFWNCDDPSTVAKIKGQILNLYGVPISDYLITITDLNNNLSATGYTNSEGTFCGFVPKDVDLLLSVESCNGEVITQLLGSFSADEDLGIITVDAPALNIFGELTDCDGQPNEAAYLLVLSPRGQHIIAPRNQGVINASFFGCIDDEITIQAVDFDNEVASEIQTHVFDAPNYTFGTLSTCGNNLVQQVSFSIDGGEPVILYDAQVSLLDGKDVCIWAKLPGTTYKMKVVTDLNGNATGRLNMTAPNSVGDPIIASFGSNILTVDQNSPPVNKVGDWVIGSIIADQGADIKIDYALKVDELVTTSTFSGKVWSDLNGDGIQDPGEEGLEISTIYVRHTDNKHDFTNYYGDPSTGHGANSGPDGSFTIVGMVPEAEYEFQFFNIEGYKLTVANQGTDDSADSDFWLDSGSLYKTDKYYLGTNEENNTIGLGIIP